ncbi:hypothetical protein P4474_12460, partial [Geobacillus stearothermophilus]|nr:hypothetical protein [Geobacillus stearothermophilus]
YFLDTPEGPKSLDKSTFLEGVNIKYVSRRLGHKDIVTTLQTYSHILDEMEQKESRQVDLAMEELYHAK